jgi:hypothetical protein
MKGIILRLLGGGGSLTATILMGIVKEIIRRIAKPEKIVQIAADLIKDAAVKDPDTDWKDVVSKLLEEEKPKD